MWGACLSPYKTTQDFFLMDANDNRHITTKICLHGVPAINNICTQMIFPFRIVGTVNNELVLQVLLVFRNTYYTHNFVYSQVKLLHQEQEQHKVPEGLTLRLNTGLCSVTFGSCVCQDFLSWTL